MKRVAVFGTHGSAKTTLVYKLAAQFKMRNKNVKVIHETARHCPFPINQDAIFQTTVHVVTSQIKKELEAEAEGFEICISDRTVSDAFIYINHLQRDNVFTRHLEKFCMHWLRQYDVLVYLEPTEAYQIADDGVRACDVDYQLAIRDDFRVLVKDMKEMYKDKLQLITAESNQVFDNNQYLLLVEEIEKNLFASQEMSMC